jgi:hypothetical protein
MSRRRNQSPTHKVEPVLPAGAYACLQTLAAMAHYGSTPNEVARYLILRSLDDLIRAGAIEGQIGRKYETAANDFAYPRTSSRGTRFTELLRAQNDPIA